MSSYDIIGAAYADIIGRQQQGQAMVPMFAGYGSNVAFGADPSGPNLAEIAQAVATRNAALVQPREPQRAREQVIGFPATPIAANSSANAVAQPFSVFRGRRLVIPSDIAGAIIINDLKVGSNSQFQASNPVPGRAFTELGVGVDLLMDTAQVMQSITLALANISGAALTFYGSLHGISAQ